MGCCRSRDKLFGALWMLKLVSCFFFKLFGSLKSFTLFGMFKFQVVRVVSRF